MLKKIYKNIYIIIKSIIIYIITMSEWVNHVKAYAEKNKISYKQALKDASPSYKTRNDKKEESKIETPLEKEKPKRKNNKKVVENITLKL
jgi:hypothetical protein